MNNLFRICVICAFFGVAVNAQENNGVFVGLEIGASEQQIKLKNPNGNESTTENTAATFGAKVGYKHFFLEWIGIRGYAGIDYTQSRVHSANNTSWSTGVFANLTYSANIDALLNFYNSENVAFGAFVGLGIGGQTSWDMNLLFSDKYRSMTDLYSDVKLGLRVNVARNHGMEFIAKIPLNSAKETFEYGIEASYKQNYQVLLGYNFSF